MLRTVYLLEGFDLIVEFHRQTNIIQPIQETVFIKRIDLEVIGSLIGASDTLRVKIDSQFRPRIIAQLLT